MNFDFLTPEIFDMLVIANLIVALILIVFRFYQDMTHEQIDPQEQRIQAHDESSYGALEDTELPESISLQTNADNQHQTSQNL